MSEPDDYAAEMHESRFRDAHRDWTERDFDEHFNRNETTEDEKPEDAQ